MSFSTLPYIAGGGLSVPSSPLPPRSPSPPHLQRAEGAYTETKPFQYHRYPLHCDSFANRPTNQPTNQPTNNRPSRRSPFHRSNGVASRRSAVVSMAAKEKAKPVVVANPFAPGAPVPAPAPVAAPAPAKKAAPAPKAAAAPKKVRVARECTYTDRLSPCCSLPPSLPP